MSVALAAHAPPSNIVFSCKAGDIIQVPMTTIQEIAATWIPIITHILKSTEPKHPFRERRNDCKKLLVSALSCLQTSEFAFIHKVRDTVLGFIVLSTDEFDLSLEVESLCASPYRTTQNGFKGSGKLLLGFAESVCYSCDLEAVTLFYYKSALRFYQKQDYSPDYEYDKLVKTVVSSPYQINAFSLQSIEPQESTSKPFILLTDRVRPIIEEQNTLDFDPQQLQIIKTLSKRNYFQDMWIVLKEKGSYIGFAVVDLTDPSTIGLTAMACHKSISGCAQKIEAFIRKKARQYGDREPLNLTPRSPKRKRAKVKKTGSASIITAGYKSMKSGIIR